MWLGEQITSRGGQRRLADHFAGIVANLPTGISQLFTSMRNGSMSRWRG